MKLESVNEILQVYCTLLQVRRMVTAIIDTGTGRISLGDIERMLNIPNWRPKEISQIAPSCGLFLLNVGYDESDFELSGDYMTYTPKAYYNDGTFDDDLPCDD